MEQLKYYNLNPSEYKDFILSDLTLFEDVEKRDFDHNLDLPLLKTPHFYLIIYISGTIRVIQCCDKAEQETIYSKLKKLVKGA